ncbi:MAG: tRNA (adenosine(37)-N6)-threonylcarbamoyltransferase complex ATPase subunit type 1 TsaE [Microscillaceae bacterium]|nr:tRNA (adenosine(37)-N6)-threonylcarbamoyltransferase complex ATPase subunit type 1 TsaE [Microscillaceae bacterium]MDW8460553.1 tRNA (adenosine(37)-N6)-threonylcarbamoyltransferase complex ATPase subunit type 1 TsaE [Cytophagales bacterium]
MQLLLEKIYNLVDIPFIAQELITLGEKYNIWLLEGEIGAGKTTLIKAICKALGVRQAVQSPTFSLVNEYSTNQNQIVYHFDFYRIQHEQEALDIGYEEYFFSSHLCLVEWASKIPSLIPENCLHIHLEKISPEERKISVFF